MLCRGMMLQSSSPRCHSQKGNHQLIPGKLLQMLVHEQHKLDVTELDKLVGKFFSKLS